MRKLLISVLNLSPYGGTVRRLRIWLPKLQQKAGCTLLCYPVDRRRVIDLLPSPGKGLAIEIVDPPIRGWKVLGYVRFFLIEMRTLIKEKPDVVLSTFLISDSLTRMALYVTNYLFGLDIKQVIYCAGSPVPVKRLGKVKGKLIGKAAVWAFRRADLVLTISESMRELLVKEYRADPARIAVVPISLTCPGNEYRSRRERTKKEFVFGVLSRLTREKSIDHVLEAFTRVAAKGAQIRLVIFGVGPQLEELQNRALHLKIFDQVAFHGWVRDPYIALSEIDCLILPSENEGTPRSILEGGCMSVPTIASMVGGIPDIILDGKTGWLFQHGDVSRLAEIMQYLVDSPESCYEAGERMKEKVLSEHTVRTEIEKLLAHLQAVVRTDVKLSTGMKGN